MQPVCPPGEIMSLMPYASDPAGLYECIQRSSEFGIPIYVSETGFPTFNDDHMHTVLDRYLKEVRPVHGYLCCYVCWFDALQLTVQAAYVSALWELAEDERHISAKYAHSCMTTVIEAHMWSSKKQDFPTVSPAMQPLMLYFTAGLVNRGDRCSTVRADLAGNWRWHGLQGLLPLDAGRQVSIPENSVVMSSLPV